MRLADWAAVWAEHFDVTPKYLDHLVKTLFYHASDRTSVAFTSTMIYQAVTPAQKVYVELSTYQTSSIEISLGYDIGTDTLIVLDDRDDMRWNVVLASIIRESRLLNGDAELDD